MWACALGHQRAAELLYGWNSSALGIPDSLGRLPLAVARSRGHTRLATALEELHTHTHMMPGDTHTPPEDTDTPATPQPQQPPSPLSTSPDTGLSSSSSLPSPSDPSSPSPSSAYSSAPAPMDTSPSSPSSSSSSLPVSPPSPSSLPPVSMWGEEPNAGPGTGLNPGGSRDSSLYLMDYESASPGHTHTYLHTHMAGGGRRAHITATLEEQLLSYSENVENEGEEEEYLEEEVLQVDMATLAEQIIEATPERIKQEDFPRGAESPLRERRDNPAIQDTWLATYLDTVDAHTHSPPRRVCPPSPLSALALQRLRPPSSAAWAEFLNASANGKMERDFALLTLTDGEQRELYEAARIIQNAFRKYKYALYKKMTQAAILIQSKFRSYYEQKRFQQSRRAAVLIQQYYRSYKEYERLKQAPRGAASHNPKIKGSFLTKKQDQAARKIMRFLRRCRHRIKELKQTRELERRGLTT
ncbi:Calmodulin-binding transcription activator 2 [Larimichthys crocea]|nr:Calmodulin-binding transcription activator 2 [Larimichthys crocea]